jgi:membrane protein YdbS with pleckstrin-like domain
MSTPSESEVHCCSAKYLRVRLSLELGLLIAISASFAVVNWVVGFSVFLFLVGVVWFRMKCKSMYRFKFGGGEIRTRKVFTNHNDVTTPFHQIQSVAAYEGVLEALLGAGTIEITTASSHTDHARFIWPHIDDAPMVADRLRALIASKA